MHGQTLSISQGCRTSHIEVDPNDVISHEIWRTDSLDEKEVPEKYVEDRGIKKSQRVIDFDSKDLVGEGIWQTNEEQEKSKKKIVDIDIMIITRGVIERFQ